MVLLIEHKLTHMLDSCLKTLLLDDFRFRVDRVECHFFLIFCTNLILSFLLLIHAIKTKNRNHSINKSKNLGYMIDDWYISNLAKNYRLLQFFISALFEEVFHPRGFVGAPQRGTNMAAVKYQKHLPLSFALETKNYYSRVPTSWN